MSAVERNVDSHKELCLVWRSAVLARAGRQGLRRAGDFVECRVLKGTTARILCDYLDFVALDRRYGWGFYRAQKEAADTFFAARGVPVIELPTGQGLAIK